MRTRSKKISHGDELSDRRCRIKSISPDCSSSHHCCRGQIRMKPTKKAMGTLSVHEVCRDPRDPGPWEVDQFAEQIAEWQKDKPVRTPTYKINGPNNSGARKLKSEKYEHPSVDEIRLSLRATACAVYECYQKTKLYDTNPKPLDTYGDFDWDKIYYRPDVPLSEYKMLVTQARLSLQNLLQCNLTHIPDPLYLRKRPPASASADQVERFWHDYKKDASCYQADVYEKIQAAHEILSEIEAGLPKGSGRAGKKKDLALVVAVWMILGGTYTFTASATDEHEFPNQLKIRMRRAIWRDAGLPIGTTKSWSVEDDWIDKQFRNHEKAPPE
jgi:hypothetical protein